MREFLAGSQASVPGLRILRGRCRSSGHGITYWALGEIVREACGVSLDDSATAAGDKLAQAVAALFDSASRAAGAAALGLGVLGLAIARLRPRLGGWAGRLYYFGVLNLALALGVAAGLAGYARPVWARTALHLLYSMCPVRTGDVAR